MRVEGEFFQSQLEHQRWMELKLLERAGAIEGLRRQTPFELIVGSVRIGRYTADATYVENGEFVIEDAKGQLTKEYKRTRLLVCALYGIRIREVTQKGRRGR